MQQHPEQHLANGRPKFTYVIESGLLKVLTYENIHYHGEDKYQAELWHLCDKGLPITLELPLSKPSLIDFWLTNGFRGTEVTDGERLVLVGNDDVSRRIKRFCANGDHPTYATIAGSRLDSLAWMVNGREWVVSGVRFGGNGSSKVQGWEVLRVPPSFYICEEEA